MFLFIKIYIPQLSRVVGFSTLHTEASHAVLLVSNLINWIKNVFVYKNLYTPII